MSKKPNEINDDEIRIISAREPQSPTKKKRSILWFVLIISGVLILCGLVVWYIAAAPKVIEDMDIDPTASFQETDSGTVIDETGAEIKAYTVAIDTIVNNNGVMILYPKNSKPRLVVGLDWMNDPNIILATQAADIRGDNGEIAGTFVLNGELLSKGESKAGYCSIIDGDLSIGFADSTPMLEQVLIKEGSFFRQYPLVVGGQIVENKPKGRAIRKALAQIGGKKCVVMSKERLTFHEFSELLVDVGVIDAIYLVGSSSNGFYVNDKGARIPTGNAPWKDIPNVNYIVWERR